MQNSVLWYTPDRSAPMAKILSVWRILWAPDFWAIVGLVAFPLFYYFPITLGQKAFCEGDIYWIYLPTRVELARALAEGRLPLWTPFVQAGLPLLADGHVTALYPLNLLLYRFIPPQSIFSYTILFNLIWTALGMYACVRAFQGSVPSAFLAGFVFGYGGFTISRVPHMDVLTTLSWFAWLIFLQQEYWRARFAGRRAVIWFILSCVAIGLQFLGGSPQIAFLNIATYSILGGFAPVVWKKDSRYRTVIALWSDLVHALFVTLSTILLGAMLGAIQLLPTLELLGFSTRNQALGRSVFSSYALDLLALTQFLFPFAYLGEPTGINMEYWGYFGVLPLLLVFLVLFRQRDSRTVVFFVLGFLMILLSLGDATPMYGWLYNVPLLNRFRAPARFLLPALFSGAFLAAISFDDLAKRLQDVRWNIHQLLLSIAASGGVLMGIILLAYHQPEVWLDVWKWLPFILIGFNVGLLILARFSLITRQTFTIVSIVGIVFDLALFSAPFLSTLTRMASPSELVQVPRTVQAMDASHTPYRIFTNRFPAVTSAAIRATLWRGLPLLYGKEGIITGYMPFSLALRRNEEFIQAMTPVMRNLMNIRYYLLPLEVVPPSTPSPFDENEPNGGLTLSILTTQPSIPELHAKGIEITSYLDQASHLPNGFLAAELRLGLADGTYKTLPIRVGIETADWAYDVAPLLPAHDKPGTAVGFPAYLSSVGRSFTGYKYIARYALADYAPVISVGVRLSSPDVRLTIERIILQDQSARRVSLATLLRLNDFALVFRSHTAAMWENMDVMPRAFIVHQAEVVPDDQVLMLLEQPNFYPERVVLLSDGYRLEQPSEGAQGDAQIEEYKSERVVIRATTNRPAYLVLTDSWYPGWSAWVDDNPTPIYRADYIFRAVRLEPGEHRVVFKYNPFSFRLGALISIVTFVVLGLVGWWRLRQ